MDISTLLEVAVHSSDSVASSVNYLGDTLGNLGSVGMESDCCSSNNYPTKPA